MPGRIVTARSINSTVKFHCVDEPLAERFDFLVAEPDVADMPEQCVSINTTKVSNAYYDFAPPHDGQPGTRDHLLNRAHTILRELMVAETSGCPIIHGASVVVNQKRFLMMADKGVGKTTFSLKCLADGLCVEGDEHIVVCAADVVARPRTLRIKHGSLITVPELADKVRSFPFVLDWNNDPIYSVAPQTRQVPWKIRPGKAQFLLFLTANHGGLTSTKALSSTRAFERLMKNVFLPEVGKAAALARLHMLVSNAECIDMRIGNLDTAVWHLRQLSNM